MLPPNLTRRFRRKRLRLALRLGRRRGAINSLMMNRTGVTAGRAENQSEAKIRQFASVEEAQIRRRPHRAGTS
jgi:hypothetical protein